MISVALLAAFLLNPLLNGCTLGVQNVEGCNADRCDFITTPQYLTGTCQMLQSAPGNCGLATRNTPVGRVEHKTQRIVVLSYITYCTPCTRVKRVRISYKLWNLVSWPKALHWSCMHKFTIKSTAESH